MVTCPNGHTNPAHARFCEECGVPIMFGVVACPHGHINPEHAHFCEECGMPIMSAVVACPAQSPWWLYAQMDSAPGVMYRVRISVSFSAFLPGAAHGIAQIKATAYY